MICFLEPRKLDPNKPDPRARAEMQAFDRLPAEARAKISDSPFGVEVAELFNQITRVGAGPGVRERLNAKGLLPCDVGVEGCVLESVELLEEQERKRIASELR